MRRLGERLGLRSRSTRSCRLANQPTVSGEAILGGRSRTRRRSIDSTSAASVVGVLSSERSEDRRSTCRPRVVCSSPARTRRTTWVTRVSDTRTVKRLPVSRAGVAFADSGASGDRFRLLDRSLNPANLVDGASGRAVCDRTSAGLDREDRLLSPSCAIPVQGTTSAASPSERKLTTSQNRMQWRFFAARFELAGTDEDRRGSPSKVDKNDGPEAIRRGI